ncbi:MAG: ABC transporter ATP-binding protein [Gammaproteobacteria bacterium]|nr:MAG: ABC transporter ATP-binding protein [Gammaproteobacteria bacterium]
MKKPKKPFILKRLIPFMGSKKYLFPLSLILSAISAVLNLLPFVFIWMIARKLFAAEVVSFSDVRFYAWLTLVSAFLAMLFYFFTLAVSHLAAFRAEVGIRKAAMERIITMPLGFFDKNQSGKMRKIIDDNASQTHTFLAHQMPDLSGTIIAPLIILVLMFIVDWRMGLISLIPIVLGFVSMAFMLTTANKIFRSEYMDSLEEMSSEAVEYVRGIPVVKTFGQSVYSFKRFVASIINYRDMVYAYTLMFRRPYSFYTVIMQSAGFFLVPFSLLFITHGGDPAQILTDFVFYILIAPNFTLLFMRSMYFQNYAGIAEEAIDRLDALLDYPEMHFEKESLPVSSPGLEFRNVSFKYEGADKNAIENISFTINQGETLALVGPSGGGKTTIARLAARFWDAGSGEILIGGIDIKKISRKNLMDSVAFVFQNTKLFKGSLRDNIVFGNANVEEADIINALELSQSKDIIDSLDMGLDTLIGSDGTYLSGGEQQRIALARAILKDAPVVLLDEATAFADPENEPLIQSALHELSKNKTTLMIAHRLTTVKGVDKILVIDQGKIAEAGSHEELITRNGIYKSMWNEYQKSVNWKV